MSVLQQLRALLLVGTLGACASLAAQTASSPATRAPADDTYPEQAYLSAAHYVNQYFGFTFELPAEAHLHTVPEPAVRDGSIPLLDLAGPAPADAEILITAFPTAGGKRDDAKLLLRQELDQDLYRGVEELRGLSKASFSGHQFYLFETRRGIEHHMLLATTLGDYILRVFLAAHDEQVVKQLEVSFEHLLFFTPATLRQHLDADAKPYDGPSISSHRLALLESDPPGKRIDPGKINGDFYENAMLGFSYRIPQGWSIQPEGAVQPAVERYRAKQDFGLPRMGRVEHTLVEACSRTLFSAWTKRPGADGQISYDEFGEVTISAMAAACFPKMKFPADPNDREAFKNFLAEFALTHPIVEDMREAKVFTQDGITLLFLEGTVAFQVPDDELSRRLSLGMAITQRRGYVLTWFFAAPHDSELRALTNERASFDAEPAMKTANAPPPGGGVAAEAAASTAGTAPVTGGAAAAPQMPTSTNNGSSTASGPDQSATTSGTSPRPSLLRPGETMASQQGNGAPIKKR